MGNEPCKYTPDEIEHERQRYIDMPVEGKRKQYVDGAFTSVDNIQLWSDYFKEKIPYKARIPEKRFRYAPDPNVNKKVAIWKGDITKLEIGAIVNSAASPDKGGQVNMAIMTKAGEFFKEECITKGLKEPGEVLVTGGYMLPAQYIMNTLAPKGQDTAILLNCYRNCLEEAKRNIITTIAFPCIATRKKNAFPKKKAAQLVLTTVRNWLQINHDYIEKVVFCLYLDEDVEIYQKAMQEFFPLTVEEICGDKTPERHSLYPCCGEAHDGQFCPKDLVVAGGDTTRESVLSQDGATGIDIRYSYNGREDGLTLGVTPTKRSTFFDPSNYEEHDADDVDWDK